MFSPVGAFKVYFMHAVTIPISTPFSSVFIAKKQRHGWFCLFQVGEKIYLNDGKKNQTSAQFFPS